jgi:hypothetical protein
MELAKSFVWISIGTQLELDARWTIYAVLVGNRCASRLKEASSSKIRKWTVEVSFRHEVISSSRLTTPPHLTYPSETSAVSSQPQLHNLNYTTAKLPQNGFIKRPRRSTTA